MDGNYACYLPQRIRNVGEISEEMELLARMATEDHMSEEGSRLYFIRIEKAEEIWVCTGRFYIMKILVGDHERGSQSIIEKMIWTGYSFEILGILDCSLSKGFSGQNKYESDEWVRPASWLGEEALYPAVSVLAVTDVSQQGSGSIIQKGAAGYIKFVPYILTIEAHSSLQVQLSLTIRPQYISEIDSSLKRSLTIRAPYISTIDSSLRGPITIRASMLFKRVAVTMDLSQESMFRSWRKAIESAIHPPDDDYILKCTPLDLISPQIVTQAWFALEDYNFKNQTNLSLRSVCSAKVGMETGYRYHLRIDAESDGESAGIFRTVIRYVPFVNFWQPVKLLARKFGPLAKDDEPTLPQSTGKGKGKQKHFNRNFSQLCIG